MIWLINFDVLAGRTRKAVLETAVGDFQKHEVTSVMAMVECPSRQQSGTWKSLTGSYPTLPTPWMDFPFLDKWALPTCPHQPQFHYSQSGEMTNLLVAGGSPSVLRPLWWLWKKRWWVVSPLFQLLEKKHSASTLLGPPGSVKAPQLAEAGHPKPMWGSEEKSTVHRQIFFCCCLLWKVRKWTVLRVFLTMQAFSFSSNLIPTEAGGSHILRCRGQCLLPFFVSAFLTHSAACHRLKKKQA